MLKCLQHASFVAALAILIYADRASAHIIMTGPLMSRGGDQKMSPCDGAKGDGPVYTFEPGTTITLTVNEVIPHPSYFRIAFDDDGDDDFVEPKSIKPIDPNRACPFDADDQCGESDFCNVVSANGATVLWDNLNPHLAQDAKTVSWNVTLPDIECENCTIQVLQVMEDTVHGAYCPQGSCANASKSLEDIYHRCIDIKLQRDATNSPGATTSPVDNMGIECKAEPAPTAGTGGVAGATAGAGGTMAAAGAGGSTGAAGAAVGVAGTAGSVAGSGGAGGTLGDAGGGAVAGAPGGPASPGGAQAGATGAAGTPPSGAAGSATVMNPQMAAGAASPVSPMASGDDGGCSVAHLGSDEATSTFAWLALASLLFIGRRRKHLG